MNFRFNKLRGLPSAEESQLADSNFQSVQDLLGFLNLYGGVGTPEAAVVAPVGSLYINRSGGAGTTLYVKESGTGNTGWVGK